MNIDQRDIEKGPLLEVLPRLYPNSISYLSELNEYRIYAEMWCNEKSKEMSNRKDIRHEGYLKTLDLGERNKKRKIDKIRFENFIVADSVNYMEKAVEGNKLHPHIQMGGIQTNSVFNEIIEADEYLLETQSLFPSTVFHSENDLPKSINIDLMALDLRHEEKSNKLYFEISTDSKKIANNNQREILLQVLGKEAFSEKLQLLHKVDRKYIRCLFEDPKNFQKDTNISRLCVAWPFYETIVIDFAGTFEDYGNACTLGISIEATENQIEDSTAETPTESAEQSDKPRIDTCA